MPPRTGSDGRRKSKSSRDNGVSKPSAMGSRSSQRRRSDSGASSNQRRNDTNSLEIQRGVRPKLDHIQCPVSQKRIMDDVLTVQGDESHIDGSLASTSYSSSIQSNDSSNGSSNSSDFSESDIGLNHTDKNRAEMRRRQNKSSRSRNTNNLEGRKSRRREIVGNSHLPTPPAPRQPRRLPKYYNNVINAKVRDQSSDKHSQKHQDFDDKILEKKQSKSTNRRQNQTSGASKLTTEIAQFKKMVADLQAISEISASSPEAMWKSRILLRSATDAERDLRASLEKDQMDSAAGKSVNAAALFAARKKMMRDYQRASDQLREIVGETERRQKAEISCLTAKEAAEAGAEPATSQKRALMGAAEQEEDFFERAMRERQAEIQKVSDGMKKVQDIYSDLAGLVDDQQEQIDKLEDLNEEAKAHTRAGLEEIQHGIWKLCAAEQHQNDGMEVNGPNDASTNRNRKKKALDPSDILKCMMACQGNPVSESDNNGVLSLEDDLYNESKTSNAASPYSSNGMNEKYYIDDVKPAEPEWNLQESAVGALQKGHAMVGDIVDAVTTGDFGEFEKRFSCAPEPDEVSAISLGDNNIGAVDGGIYEEQENFGRKYPREETLDHDSSHRHSDRKQRRSRPRQSPSSHSNHRHVHESRNYQKERDRWEEDNYRETRIKSDRHRRRSRHVSSR